MPAFDAGDYAGLAAIMLDSARLLADAGCDFLICPDNSAHLAWDDVQAAHTTAVDSHRRAGRDGSTPARFDARGLLGTRFTMTGPVYPAALGALGIEVVVPTEADQADVDRIIFDELIDGVLLASSRERYVEVIQELASRGADSVALACTEIPLLVAPGDSPLPTLDSTRLLAAAALTARSTADVLPDLAEIAGRHRVLERVPLVADCGAHLVERADLGGDAVEQSHVLGHQPRVETGVVGAGEDAVGELVVRRRVAPVETLTTSSIVCELEPVGPTRARTPPTSPPARSPTGNC